jgi:hypothetical protein
LDCVAFIFSLDIVLLAGYPEGEFCMREVTTAVTQSLQTAGLTSRLIP